MISLLSGVLINTHYKMEIRIVRHKKAKFQVTEDLIGKYINQVLWSDVKPVGKIVGIKGKTKVLIQPVVASENLAKMEFIAGGFAGHCVNQYDQRYEFSEDGEVYESPISNTRMKKKFWKITDYPSKFYDYNF